jgi:hypothetical protein
VTGVLEGGLEARRRAGGAGVGAGRWLVEVVVRWAGEVLWAEHRPARGTLHARGPACRPAARADVPLPPAPLDAGRGCRG